jgi:opacity protein-like surface antigen
MKARGWVLSGAVAVAAVLGVARAADSNESAGRDETQVLFEVAGFGSLAVGGQFTLDGDGTGSTGTGSRVSLADHGAFALAGDVRADQGSWYELFYSREATDLRGNFDVPRTNVTVEYLHVGGTVLLNDEFAVRPYAVGGLGVTRLTPGEQGSTDTRFSASLGLGLRWPVTQRLFIRLEGRAFVTLVNDSTATFCRSDESGLLCRIHGNGQTFVQGEFLAGAGLAF